MRREILRALLLVGLTLAGFTPARAQNTETPLRKPGLFGATRSDSGDRQHLTCLFDIREALESELPPAAQFQVSRGALRSGGYSSMLVTSADYMRTGRRVQLAGSLFTSFAYYPQLDRVTSVSHSGSVGATLRLPKNSSLQVNSTAAYAPAYLYQLFPASVLPAATEAIAADPDYRIDQRDSYSYGADIAFALGSPRKTRVTASAEYRHTDFPQGIVARIDPTSSAAGIEVSRRLTRNRRVSLEYQYRTGNFEFSGATREHRLAVGAEYVRPLTATRRATLRFNVTPAIVELPPSTALASLGTLPVDRSTPVVDARLFRLQGEARADVDLGRTWRATGIYQRGLDYLAILTEPVFSDAARVDVGGLISRRIDVSASGGHAVGASAIHRDSGNLTTSTANVRVRYALTHSFAVYSQYLYYYYDLRRQANLAPALPRVFEQHEIRLGFMLFVRPISDNAKGKKPWPERTRPKSY